MQDNLQEAVEVLSQALQSNPLSRLAWLQFIFEGDATKFPPNFSASSDGNVGIGASSHGGRLSMDDVPQIVFHCDIETFVQVVHGRLPLDQARASGQLSVEGGQNVWGGGVGEQADSLLESLVRELGNRFTRSLSND